MNCAYIVTFGLSFVVWFGPWCSATNLYPPVLTICALLYWINCFYHYYLNSHGYYLKWIKPQELDVTTLSFKNTTSIDEQKQELSLTNETPLISSDSSIRDELSQID